MHEPYLCILLFEDSMRTKMWATDNYVQLHWERAQAVVQRGLVCLPVVAGVLWVTWSVDSLH